MIRPLAAVLALVIVLAGGAVGQDTEAARRAVMVAEQIAGRAIADVATLEAMRAVPRHEFVPAASRDVAYGDHPVPIGFGQTISQPYIVAYMTERLRPVPGMKVLEVGTGSGYHAAVLSGLCRRLYTIERIRDLKRLAETRFDQLRITNVTTMLGDGGAGCVS